MTNWRPYRPNVDWCYELAVIGGLLLVMGVVTALLIAVPALLTVGK